MDKLIKISSTSKGEKLPVKSFEDKISFLKRKKKARTEKELLKLEAGVTTTKW